MQVLDVKPKDWYVTLEISITELRKLHRGLALAHIDYDGKNKAEQESAEFIKKKFWPALDELLEELKHGTGPLRP